MGRRTAFAICAGVCLWAAYAFGSICDQASNGGKSPLERFSPKSYAQTLSSHLSFLKKYRDYLGRLSPDSASRAELLLVGLFKGEAGLTSREIQTLRSTSEGQLDLALVTEAHRAVTTGYATVSGIYKSWSLRPWIFHIGREGDSRLRKATNALRAVSVPGARFFLPFGELLPYKLEGETAPLFVHPPASLTKRQKDLLKEHKVYDLYKQHVAERRGPNAHWHHLRRYLYWAAKSAITVSTALVANLLYVMGNNVMSVDSHLNHPDFRLKPHQIALVNESVPFPHTAIQVGDTVYSPGRQLITESSTAYYMRSKEVHAIARQKGWFEEESGEEQKKNTSGERTSWQWAQDSAMDTLGWLFSKTGWDKQSRTITVIILNVGVDEAKRVQKYFTDQVNKEYMNHTMVWDCLSEVLYGIDPENKLPLKFLYDASPGQTTQLFAAMKTTGQGPFDVEEIRMVVAEEGWGPTYQILRNAEINLLESKIFIKFFLFDKGYRAYLASQTSPEERRFFSESMEEVRQELVNQAAEAIKLEEEFSTYYEIAKWRYGQGEFAKMRRYLDDNMFPFLESETARYQQQIDSDHHQRDRYRQRAIFRKMALTVLKEKVIQDFGYDPENP